MRRLTRGGIGRRGEGTHEGRPYGLGGGRGSQRAAYFVLPTQLLRREVVGEGALRGRSPRTR
ncbi:MAG: hypothetical protein OXF50_01945, partial [Caldilineaceae bacterium]|nr:hypothetical protein [Caldilineaceae bacterium]